ncbi:MAG: RING-HC finger protein [Gammaproteobacteria bacterium]|nr:RING-HC finger protein [Gammaproteobacteria bacterium]
MSHQITCEICGNAIDELVSDCPYCNSPVEQISVPIGQGGKGLHSMINLEKGMPLVKDALERMHRELFISRKQGIKVITLIHGYGSTGKGGGIRDAVRQDLQFQFHKKKINDIVFGEDFSRKSGKGRYLIRRFPFLTTHRDINRANPGITLVIL